MGETAKRPWTYEEYLRLPDDGNRYEIVEGELLVTPSPLKQHQVALQMLSHLFLGYLESHPVGQCFIAPFDVILSANTVVEPDLLFVTKERLSVATEKGLTAAPDLVVEVLSPTTRRRDLGVKRQAYAKHGVREYWIVDPEARSVEIYVLRRRVFVKKVEATSGEVESPLVVPGLSIPLAKLFS
jgi:Uma2 family endonuclease